MSEQIIYRGDCLEVMRGFPDGFFTSVVTDPPYGLKFMGKAWDHGVPGVPFWEQTLRVCKPGAMLLAFGGTRTHHRLMVAIEDAGWEIRDCVMWMYGSGFPKSLDISKAIDRAAGVEREVVGSKIGQPGYSLKDNDTDTHDRGAYGKFKNAESECSITAPATEAAKTWNGYGTALKPAWEPIIVAMKPCDGTFANNALTHGVAGLNIDGGRVGSETMHNAPAGNKAGGNSLNMSAVGMPQGVDGTVAHGRWPANVILDEAAGEMLDEQAGSAVSRFFYCAKASKKDRGEGNKHPTVKPTELMKYLVGLVSPPEDGVVLDPFCGSGSTGKACKILGADFVGIELDEDSAKTAEKRIADA